MQAVEPAGGVIVDTYDESPNKKSTIRVLHVDDDHCFLEISKLMLMDMGNFEIDHACCVDEAFKKLANSQYDAVISDYEMPKKDGLQFLKELREGKNDVPFILFTGKGREEVVIQALNLGADHYVNKHVSAEAVYHELAHLVSSAIEKSRDKLRIENDSLALHNVHDAIVSSDANFTITAWNKAAEEFFGYSSIEVLQQKIEDVFKKIQITPSLDELICKLKTSGQFQGEIFYQKRSGQKRRAELKISSIMSKNGKFLGTVAVCSDITERKKSEELLAQSESKYLRLFNASEVGMFRTKIHNSEILECNEKLLRILGYTSEEMKGKPATLYYADPGQRQELVKILQAKGQLVDSEIKLVSKLGEVKTCLLSSKICPEQGVFEGSIIDITERKKDERALAESEEKYRNLFQNAPDIIITTDMTGKIISVNKTISQFGFSEKDLVKRPILDLVPSENAQKMLKGLKNMAAGNSYHNEIEIITPIGKRSIEYNSNPIWVDGKVIGYQTILRDVTERKKTEDSMRESMDKNQVYLENTPLALFVSSPDGKAEFTNKAACNLLGYSREELSRISFADVLVKEDLSQAIEMFNAFKNRDSGVTFREFRLRRKDGEIVNVSLNAARLPDGKLITFCEDITQRKKIQQSLIENEVKFRTLAEQSPNMIFINHKGRVVYANKKCEELTGYSAEELCSADFNFLSLNPPEYAEAVKLAYAKHMRGEVVPPYEYVLIAKGSQRINAIINTTLIEFGGDNAILGIVTDVTELKQVQDTMRKSEERYRELANFLPVIVFEADLTGKITFFSKRAFELTDITPEDIEKGSNITSFVLLQERERAMGNMKKSMAGEDPDANEYTLVRKNGATYPALVKTTPIISENRVIGVRGLVIDITERKKAEVDLKESRDKLELMNEKLRVVGSLSRHDVRNKLSAVNGYAYLLKKKHADQNDIVEGLAKIEQQVKDSAKIFEFARMYERLGVEELVHVEVGKVMDEAVALFSDLTIKVVNDCYDISVQADSFLRQMFFNFMDNTRKYGIKATSIRVYCEMTELNDLLLIYEDDGVGISAANKSELFTEGFSTGGTTGFGLFLIKKMMDVYGWRIQENGIAGEGAKFIITIPKLNKNGKENYQIK